MSASAVDLVVCAAVPGRNEHYSVAYFDHVTAFKVLYIVHVPLSFCYGWGSYVEASHIDVGLIWTT